MHTGLRFAGGRDPLLTSKMMVTGQLLDRMTMTKLLLNIVYCGQFLQDVY